MVNHWLQYPPVVKALNILLPTQVSATDAAGSLDIRAGNNINIPAEQQTFGGPHDSLNAPHYYDATGNNLPASQAGSPVWNPINVLIAAPVGLSVLNSQVPLLDPIKAGINQNQRDQNK